MQRTFKTKPGALFITLLTAMLLAMAALFWFHRIVWAVLLLAINVVLSQMLVKTEYRLDDDTLTVFRGVLPLRRIALSDIADVQPVTRLFSWTAVSSRGFNLVLRNGSRCFVSPENGDAFRAELLRRKDV